MAFDVQAVTLLSELSNALREHYLNDNLFEHHGWFGRQINRLFDFSENHEIRGQDHFWQVEAYKSRPIRTSRDIGANFGNHSRFEVAKLRARLSETAASNDFSRFDGSVRVSLFDLERKDFDPKQYVTNTAPVLAQQLIQHLAESMALHRMVDESAKIGTVNSVAKQNDNTLYASATSTPVNAGTTGIRILITGGSIAFFQPGTIVRIYSGSTATVRVTNAFITDYNPVDNSIGLKRWDSTTRATTTNGNADPENLIGVTTNDTIFLSGERNLGMISMAEWMAETVSAGDTLFNVDRSLPDNAWMRPTTYAAGSSNVPFDPQHLDTLAAILGYVTEGFSVRDSYIAMHTPELDNSFRQAVGTSNIVIMPTTEQQGVFARYGFEGSIFVHPTLGKISLTSDPFAIPNRMQLLRPGDWMSLVGRRFGPVPRATAMGHFYNVVAADGTGTLEYQSDYFGLLCDVCKAPRRQAQLTKVQ